MVETKVVTVKIITTTNHMVRILTISLKVDGEVTIKDKIKTNNNGDSGGIITATIVTITVIITEEVVAIVTNRVTFPKYVNMSYCSLWDSRIRRLTTAFSVYCELSR